MITNSENLRDIVCELLLEIEREQTPSHVAIRRMLEKYQYLGSGERGFISRLTRGTLERRMTLDWMIEQFSSIKVKKMKPVIRTILRMSVYQIKYMDGVPESAVCNEAVKLAKKRGFKNLSGFVNGILRNMIRNPEKSELPEDNLSVYYSQPKWLADY
ncbi:transcription antitermination factor NusB [Frisingicoccus sp.]|uniref:transcription antitermination factor NusB n=1 Tax=Frisingicoccus sp. TaxID=1918627 RepID=UPI00399C3B57